MADYKKFETDRLDLKPVSVEDAEFILELVNKPKWLKFIGDRNIKSVEDAAQYISNKMTPQLHKLGYSNYVLIRKTDGVKLGTCGLYNREGLEGVDIGFALFPEYEGSGYALEAANRLKQAAQDDFGIDKLHAITVKDNLASQRLIEKLGLRFKKIIQLADDDEKLLLYSIDL